MSALVLGSLLGAGCWVILRAVQPRPTPLAVLVASIHRPAPPSSGSTRIRQRLVGLLGAAGSARQAQDLAIVGRSAEQHAVERLGTAVALAALPLASAALMMAAGVTGVLLPAAVIGLIALPIGLWVPELTLQRAARARRDDAMASLSAYLDLVTVLLAGGAGTETALLAAADAGDSAMFVRLRDALTAARTHRRSLWDALADLGRELGLPELVELAASVELAGAHGARVAASIEARATALSAAQLARVEARANASTEQMGLPTVALFLGFLVLLGYPALHQVMNGFG